jgi:hypothetical protein
MQTESTLRITFNPGGYVLLDFRTVDGSLLSDEVEPGMEQQSSVYASIGAVFAAASADGGARRTISYTRTIEHASRAEAMIHQWLGPQQLPFGVDGTLTVEMQNGPSFEMEDAVLHAAVPRLSPFLCHATDTLYRLSAGRLRPLSGLPVKAGYPFTWWAQEFQEISSVWGGL